MGHAVRLRNRGVLLVLTLFIGTGAGTAAGSKSWLAIGGHRFGQPAELAKLAVI